jgi:hypothetical protein
VRRGHSVNSIAIANHAQAVLLLAAHPVSFEMGGGCVWFHGFVCPADNSMNKPSRFIGSRVPASFLSKLSFAGILSNILGRLSRNGTPELLDFALEGFERAFAVMRF